MESLELITDLLSQPKYSGWNDHNPCGLTPKYFASRFDDKKGNRFYYFQDDNGDYQTAAGITSWLSKVMPESPFLTDWKLKYGKDWGIVLNLTADYGTLMHSCIGHMMVHNEQPPKSFIDAAQQTLRELRKFDKSVSEDMIYKNLISFQRFRQEYNIEPLLVEGLLVCQTKEGYYYCLTQDLLAKVSPKERKKVQVQEGFYVKGDKKGQPKFVEAWEEETTNVIACIDFKSNPFNKDKKGFFETHKYQLIGTKKAVEQNFGIKVDRLFNWSPSNWRTDIGDYTLHEWKIEDKDIEVFELYEQLGAKTGAFKPKGDIEEFVDYADGVSYSDMYRKFPYLDYVKQVLTKEV